MNNKNQNIFNLFSTTSNMSTTYPNSSDQRIDSLHQFFTRDTTEYTTNQRFSYGNHSINASNLRSGSNTTYPTPASTHRREPSYDRYRTLTTTSSEIQSSVIMCVTEGRGHAKGTIGVAAIDLYHPILLLSQFDDNTNYDCLITKFNNLSPNVVIVSKTIINEENRLYETIAQYFGESFIRQFERRYFNESEGLEMIRNFRCDESSSIEIELKTKYYCLSACAALLRYIETVEHVIYAPKSLRILFEGSLNTMSIDPTTARLLELIVNLNDPKSGHSLCGAINKTKTRSGYRLLRSNLLQPSTDRKLIEKRLDMIEAIVSSQELFDGLDSLLTQFSGIEFEKIMCCLVQTYKSEALDIKIAERKIESIIILKHIISLIDPIVDTLRQCDTNVFDDFIGVLSDERFAHIMIAINDHISEDCKYTKVGHNMKLEKCQAIKKGHNALLDIARDAYSETIDDIYHLIEGYKDKYKDTHPLNNCYTNGRGYHIEIVLKNANKYSYRLPNEFTKIVYNKNKINFTTQELINKNNRINSAVEEIYLMSDVVIKGLIEKIRQFIGCLYNLSEVLANIDLVFSFASQCSLANYVRPSFGTHLSIRQGRHPILEKVLNRKPVANNIHLSVDSNFLIITGPNMSGKSTLLKQVAILQVMAQIGSFIPAEYGTFRICDKLFSRIGNNDEIETNSSTFMVEMREISYILHNLSDTSLVIIDELGRGTSVEEGVGLCFAICEQIQQTNAFTLLATHFIELTKLENFYLNVENFNFGFAHSANEEQNDESLDFTHILKEGPTEELFYGLRLASYTAMDVNILKKAESFAIILNEQQNQSISVDRDNETQKILYKVSSVLMTILREGTMPGIELLTEIQTHYRNQIEGLSETTDRETLENDFLLV